MELVSSTEVLSDGLGSIFSQRSPQPQKSVQFCPSLWQLQWFFKQVPLHPHDTNSITDTGATKPSVVFGILVSSFFFQPNSSGSFSFMIEKGACCHIVSCLYARFICWINGPFVGGSFSHSAAFLLNKAYLVSRTCYQFSARMVHTTNKLLQKIDCIIVVFVLESDQGLDNFTVCAKF